MGTLDNRNLEQREAAIRYHIERIGKAEKILRRAGYHPDKTPAKKADKILEKNG